MEQPQKQLIKLLLPFLVAFVLVAAVGIIGLKTMMGARSFSVGENLWAKNQKNITIDLLNYLFTSSPESAASFEASYAWDLEFKQAREIMLNSPWETERLHSILLSVGMLEKDVSHAVWFQSRFHKLTVFKNLVGYWAAADEKVLTQNAIYEQIKTYHQQPDPVAQQNLASLIRKTDRIIQPLEEKFGTQLSLVSHKIHAAIVSIALVFLIFSFFALALVTRNTLLKEALSASALSMERQRAAITLAAIGDAVVSVDEEGNLDYMNEVARQLLGQGKLPKDVEVEDLDNAVKMVDEQSGTRISSPLQQLAQSGQLMLKNESSHSLVRNDGSAVPVSWIASRIMDGNIDRGAVLVMRDTSRERQLIERLGWLAHHDTVTSLLNRRAFENRLSEVMDELRISGGQERRGSSSHVLIFLDLDQFKIVNDTAGHAAGDQLLCLISERVSQTLRKYDVFARMGGDEFGILLLNCSEEAAIQRAEEIRSCIAACELTVGSRKFLATASIGLVVLNKSIQTIAAALSAADLACYKAKDSGRNRVEVYSDDDRELSLRYSEMNLVSQIQKALADDGFVLYAQPIVALSSTTKTGTGQIDDDSLAATHFELLLRMRGENGQLVPPGLFIPAAERYGLMPLLDRWVINQAFTTIASLNAGNPTHAHCVYAINLSGATFCETDFIAHVSSQFLRYGIPHRQICFEITETQAVTNLSHATSFISAMRALGCSFALDDFGAGMSSFGYLKHLPIDYLKIDGLLVKGMTDNDLDKTMVEMINHLGHAMKTLTIGEYAERMEIVDALRESRVDFAQGYALGYPQSWPKQG